MRDWKYTGGRYADPEPIRAQRHDWAVQWCEVIADEVGGLDASSHQRLYLIVHEMRRRIEAGDYTRPERVGPEKPMI